MTTTARAGAGRRAAGLKPLILAPMIQLARELGAADIAIGTPLGSPPREAVAAASRAMEAGLNQYADPAGLAELRSMLANRLSVHARGEIDPRTEVTVTAGSTEAVLVALLTVTDPGDEVIILEPAFETYSGAAEVAGCTPVPVPLAQPGWRIDPDLLAAAFTERTAAVIVNTPHNPTGRVFTEQELAQVLDLCERHRTMCISDELYADFVFQGGAHVSALAFPEHRDRVIVTGSLSKANEMCGWRIGYCVTDPRLGAVLRRVHERTSFSTSTPLQYGAAAVPLASCGADQFEQRRQEMVRRLTGMGFDVHPPEGGWFVMAGVAGLGLRAEEFSAALLRQARVLVAPGTPFFHDTEQGQRWIRTTFVKDPGQQTRALDALEDFLSTPANEGTTR